MCGIVGCFNIDIDRRACVNMMSAIKHRGPDDDGMYLLEEAALFLGHVRLSIIDVSSAGHQPMFSLDRRYVIIFNGEIYNYLELRGELALQGVSFRSNTDTEVLLESYIRWGEQCLQKVKGMFAFAIYDHVTRALVLARDRFGEKPLYFAKIGRGIIFGSEVKALLSSELIERRINIKRLPEFLAHQSVHYPETLLDNVLMIPPGSFMKISNEGSNVVRYWSPSLRSLRISKKEALEEVRRLLLASIQSKLVADVPLGVFLSGGVDSSVILGAASQVSSSPVNTFTVAFENPKFKDGYYSSRTAAAFNANHHEILLTEDDVLKDIPQAWRCIDNPSADGLNTYLVSRAVSSAGIKVALSGLGGDELFGGYSSFRYLWKLSKYGRYLRLIPQVARRLVADRLISERSSISQIKMAEALASDLSVQANYSLTRRYFFDFQVNSLSKELGDIRSRRDCVEFSGRTYTSVSMLEMNNYMHDVLLKDTDQMSMAHGLEVRVPFLDNELVDFVLGLSDDFKSDDQYNKPLLIEAMKDFLPEEVITRQKQGFVMPIDQWMKGPLREQCEFNLSSLKAIPQLDHESIQRFWHLYINGNPSVNWARLWLLNNLGAWVNNQRITG